MEEEAAELAIPQTMPRARHIKKRALKNKALAIEFNEKDLKDFITGFHKRKKKRRKEAQKQQEEALRRKRIENRKKRKLERELGFYDGTPPPTRSEPDDYEYQEEEDAENELDNDGDDGTKTYENEDFKITVTTSEIAPEGEPESQNTQEVWQHYSTVDKKHNLPVSKKKTFKKSSKHRSRPEQQKKRDKRKTGKKNKKKAL